MIAAFFLLIGSSVPSAASNNGDSSYADRDLEDKSVIEVYENKPSAIILEVEKLALQYATYLQDSYLSTVTIFSIGSFLLLAGILTKRLSLAFIMSIFIFHYIEEIKTVEDLSYGQSILNFFKNLIESTNHEYISVLIISIVMSLITVYLLGALRLFLGLAATYFFYITYIDSLVNVTSDYQKYIFYLTVLIIFLLVYFLFEKAITVIFVALFSLTGSLIVFMTIEKVFNINWELTDILVIIRNDWEALFPSYKTALYFILSGMGAYIQLAYITPLRLF